MNGFTAESALTALHDIGGILFPFRKGYAALGELLDALPRDAWRKDEAVLSGLVLHLVKQGNATLAKSYLTASRFEFEKTYQFDMLQLLLALHLGEPVSKAKLASWRRLERELPVSDPLLLGLYYNAYMAMLVRSTKLEEARVAAQQAISCYREDGHIYLEHFIHIHLADIDVVEGRLKHARRRLSSAKSCLEQSQIRYGNERDVIEIIELAIDYECGRLERVRKEAPRLRASLMKGDSWSELFFQLARLSVLSCYFLEGRIAAQKEIEIFQADYARRHSGPPTTIDALDALIWHLEWHPNEASRILDVLQKTPMDSAIGDVIVNELDNKMERDALAISQTPRNAIVAALHKAQKSRGRVRNDAIETAIRLALESGHIAPFLENRDVFLGVSSKLAQSKFARSQRSLARLTNLILRKVDQSYVVPDKLMEMGFNRRQYRVTAALQSGASNKQMARQLGTTEATVKYHLTSLYRLSGTRSRREFIDYIDEIEIFSIS